MVQSMAMPPVVVLSMVILYNAGSPQRSEWMNGPRRTTDGALARSMHFLSKSFFPQDCQSHLVALDYPFPGIVYPIEVQVMETKKEVLGQEHPNTWTSQGNLAWTLKSQNRTSEALGTRSIYKAKRNNSHNRPQ